MQEDPNDLREAVERLHGCEARLREVVAVRDQFRGETAWEGVVHVFDLKGHPEATVCFAWSSPIGELTRRRFYAVLRLPPVSSPIDAIRASIVSDHKQA